MGLKTKKRSILMNKFLKKIKSQAGISGVVVALMLVLVGVVAVAGIKIFLDNQKSTIETATTNQVNQITTGTTGTTGSGQ
jgi:Tfp pilus assembly protein PilX